MEINIIVSFCKNFGIGINNTIPWKISEDIDYFKNLTNGHTVLMGKDTYLSIPEKRRPLKNRFNIVITSTPDDFVSNSDVLFCSLVDAIRFLERENSHHYLKLSKKCFIIGGEKIYDYFMTIANNIYITQIDKIYKCDRYFPLNNFDKYEITNYSKLHFSDIEKCNYRFITYNKTTKYHNEYVYSDNMKNIISNGELRQDRTGTGTMSIFAPNPLRFDISKNIPIITTKFLSFNIILKELLWFIKGQTDSKILEKQGVNIWKDNTSRDFLDNRNLYNYKEGDIGPMYGFNWLFAGAIYKGCDYDYTGQGFNQIEELIKNLKNDPFSRRHMITTFIPQYVNQGVLPPCHSIILQFNVKEEKREKWLSCHCYNRSNDTFLGQPFNIASTSILTYIIAKKCNMKPLELIISLGDCHVYLNHIEQVNLQLTRKPLPFPILELDDTIINKEFKDILIEDFNLIGYLSHPIIKAKMAI